LPAARAAPGTPDRIVWVGRKALDAGAVATARQRALGEAENEYRRLLYVAMTRAADRLIVAGCEGERQRPKGCWYDLVLDGLRGREGFSSVGEGDAQIWRYRKVADTPTEPAAVAALPAVTPRPWPDWLRQAAPVETETAVAVTPSEGDETTTSERFAGGGEVRRKALARGVLVHRLTQSLPDIAAERREEAARRYLARAGAEFGAAEQNELTVKTLQLFDDARFAALFAPGSRAEVPIVGRIARPGRTPLAVSGQIDRPRARLPRSRPPMCASSRSIARYCARSTPTGRCAPSWYGPMCLI
jgi:ATP-dependent helicase/nuclease subunit A